MIPEKWEQIYLSEALNKIIGGGTPSRKNSDYWIEKGIPWVTVKDLKKDIIENSEEHITEKGLKNSSSNLVPSGTVIICTRMAVGKSVRSIRDVAINQDLKGLITNRRIDDIYLHYLIVFKSRHLERLGIGSTVKGIVLSDLQKLKVLLPPLSEQKKIAEILSTWDRAIELTEKLIEAKEKKKRGLMQQLLTGKKRFPMYNTANITTKSETSMDWKSIHLSDCADVLMSNVDKKSKDGEKEVFLCNYVDVYKNDIIKPDMKFMIATAKDMSIKKFLLKNDDVIITKDSETPNDIAVPAYVKGDFKNVICGYHLAIIRTKKELLLGSFLHLLLQLKTYQYYFFTLANGVTRFGLGLNAIKKAIITLPSVDEQRDIVKILFGTQEEIEKMKIKVKALQNQKRGLMQKLLTGKWKVAV